MKKFYIIFFTFVFFTGNAFGYHCWFRPYSGDIRVAGINGRLIYTLFTFHLSNEYKDFYNTLNLDISITDKIALWHDFLNKHADTINSESSDFLQISSLLASEKIDWIGIEHFSDTQELKNQVQRYRLDKEGFDSYSDISIFWNEENTDDLLYLLHPVEIKLLAEYPNNITLDRTDKIRIIPLENRDLQLRSSELIVDLMQKIEEMSDTGHITDEQEVAFIDLVFDDEKNPSSLIDSQDVEEFFTNFRIEDSEIITKLREFIDLQNAFAITHQERDDFAVQSILNQKGNGIVLRGISHKESVENGLTQVCVDSGSL